MALADAIFHFWMFYQPKDMGNLAYYNKFKSLVEVAEQHGGNIALHPALMKLDIPDDISKPDEQRVLRNKTKDKFLAHTFEKKACKIRYGKLLDELHHGIHQGRNGYPDTVEAAYTMICECKDTGLYRGAGSNHHMFFLAAAGSGGKGKIVPPANGGRL
eukprot:11654191-Ditylum_brightwellii.AAC.3